MLATGLLWLVFGTGLGAREPRHSQWLAYMAGDHGARFIAVLAPASAGYRAVP